MEVPADEKAPDPIADSWTNSSAQFIGHDDDKLESATLLEGPADGHTDPNPTLERRGTFGADRNPCQGAIGRSMIQRNGMQKLRRSFSMGDQTVRQIMRLGLRRKQGMAQDAQR